MKSTKTPQLATAAALVLGTMVATLVFAKATSQPAMILALVAAAPFLFIALRKLPLVVFTALLFVGNFKTVPAQGISLSDPTLILLLLSAAAIFIELLFMISGSTGWTIWRLFAGQWAVVAAFSLLLVCAGASYLYTTAPVYGLDKLVRLGCFEVVLFFGPLLLLKDRRGLRHVLRTTVILALVLALRDMSRALHPSTGVLRGETDVTQIGDAMLLAVAILVCLYYKFEKPFTRPVLWLSIPVLVVGLIACAARGPVAALLVTLLVTVWVIRTDTGLLSRRRILLTTIAAVAIAVPSISWIEHLPGMEKKVEWKEAELDSMFSGSLSSGGTVSQRLSFYQSALDALAAHPVLGLGVGGWSMWYYGEDIPRYPHNFILEVAAEEGFLGLAVLGTLLFLLARSAVRLFRFWPLEFSFLFPGLLFLVIYNSITGDLEARFLWFWAGIIAATCRMVQAPDPHLAAAMDVEDRLPGLAFRPPRQYLKEAGHYH